MKNKNREVKQEVFLDTSALIAGLNSPTGASGFIISLFKANEIFITISSQIIEETERTIKRKFPLLLVPFLDFLMAKPRVVKKISMKARERTQKILNSEDTDILSAAITAKTKYLVTLDKRFAEKGKKCKECLLVSPAQFLEIYRNREKT